MSNNFLSGAAWTKKTDNAFKISTSTLYNGKATVWSCNGILYTHVHGRHFYDLGSVLITADTTTTLKVFLSHLLTKYEVHQKQNGLTEENLTYLLSCVELIEKTALDREVDFTQHSFGRAVSLDNLYLRFVSGSWIPEPVRFYARAWLEIGMRAHEDFGPVNGEMCTSDFLNDVAETAQSFNQKSASACRRPHYFTLNFPN